jgi:predicted DNA-binding protein
MSSLIRRSPPEIMKVVARSLNTMIPGAESNYIERLEDLIVKHSLIERVRKPHESVTSKETSKLKLDIIYDKQKKYMKRA